MFEKLRQLDNRYAELQARLENGEIYSDPAEYARCMKELRELEPIVMAYREADELTDSILCWIHQKYA
mgnify:CR=1 FL=1